MANLSPDERVIIAKHPLGNSLDQLRKPLRRIEQSYQPGPLSYDGAVDSYDQGPKKAISRLLYVLQGHGVALDVRSKTGNGDIASKLSTLFRRIRNGDFNYEYYRLLSRLVIKQAADVDIWNAIFDLIITVSRTNPLQAFLSPSMATPSHIHPPRSKVVSKLINWWKGGSLRK